MTDESKPEKKIIIDEDWKSQVEAEKEAARKDETSAAESQPQQQGHEHPMPPPDLLFLASTLYYQSLIALGAVPNPATKQATTNLDHARHTIDLIQVLWDKTEGNRTAEETDALETMLHELRMAFVSVEEQGRR